MIRRILFAAPCLAWSALAAGAAPASVVVPAPSPGEIVAAAAPAEWTAIPASDLLIMDLAPDAKGKPRRVVIQLIPPPFSQGWVGNIRRLAAVHWWDGTSVNRVQDNYVVQWGDADGEDAAKAKALPGGLTVLPEARYVETLANDAVWRGLGEVRGVANGARLRRDVYAQYTGFWHGWPVGYEAEDTRKSRLWPVHCYGMVGVGRNLSPDTGSGAELYTVTGTPPRHLDRNIALVGRVIEGIELLSSLPRGTGALGFYEHAEERVPIVAVRLGGEVASLPAYQYLSTESDTFARYAEARANRRDPFFIRPAGGADVCNIPVPVRRKP